MNWIDRKYKELLGKRSFPDSMKKEGWERAQDLLNAEFGPQPAAGAGRRSWQIGLGSVIIAAVTGTAIWMQLPDKERIKPTALYQPRTQPIPTVQWEEEEAELSAPEWFAVLEAATTNTEAPEHQAFVPSASITSASASAEDEYNSGPKVAETIVFDQEQTPAAQSHQPSVEESQQNDDLPAISAADPFIEAGEELGAEELKPAAPPGEESSQVAAQDFTQDQEKDDREGGQLDGISLEDTRVLVEDQHESVAENKSIAAASHENEENKDLHITELEEAETDITAAADEPEIADGEDSEESPAAENWHLAFPGERVSEDFEIPKLKDKRFSLSVLGGYHFVDKLLAADQTSYLHKRQEEEMPVWAMTTSMNLTYYLNSRWTLGTGFTYAEYGEETRYQFPGIDTVYLDGRYYDPHRFRNDLVGLDSTRVIDSINRGHWGYYAYYEKEDTSAEANNGRSNWTYLEIPLLVGYRFGSGALRPWLRSGVSLGLPVQTSFRYINASGTGLETPEQAQQQVAPLQWSVLLQMGIDYKIGRHWSVLLNGAGSLQLNSALRQSGVRQQYYRLGGTIGVAYHF